MEHRKRLQDLPKQPKDPNCTALILCDSIQRIEQGGEKPIVTLKGVFTESNSGVRQISIYAPFIAGRGQYEILVVLEHQDTGNCTLLAETTVRHQHFTVNQCIFDKVVDLSVPGWYLVTLYFNNQPMIYSPFYVKPPGADSDPTGVFEPDKL